MIRKLRLKFVAVCMAMVTAVLAVVCFAIFAALRGNVGAELTAVLDAAGADRLAFLPALPKMGRITRNGIHYIDSVPVADSVFGQDPFEPVTASSLEEIIAAQSEVPVALHGLEETASAGRPGLLLPLGKEAFKIQALLGICRGAGRPAPLIQQRIEVEPPLILPVGELRPLPLLLEQLLIVEV